MVIKTHLAFQRLIKMLSVHTQSSKTFCFLSCHLPTQTTLFPIAYDCSCIYCVIHKYYSVLWKSKTYMMLYGISVDIASLLFNSVLFVPHSLNSIGYTCIWASFVCAGWVVSVWVCVWADCTHAKLNQRCIVVSFSPYVAIVESSTLSFMFQ